MAGRFTSADAPFADQEAGNPQSWNLYQYGYNNPTANLDHDGRSVWVKGAKIASRLAKGGERLAAFAENVEDFRRLTSASSTTAERVAGGLMLLTEAAPISGHDIESGINIVIGAVEAGQKIYSTYTKTNPDTGQVCTGRVSGTGTPEENVAARDRSHHKTKEGFGPAKLDVSSTDYAAIRGREEQKIVHHGGARKRGGSSGNAIGGVSANNGERKRYIDAAVKAFGDLMKKL